MQSHVSRAPAARRTRSGFTLIEIMVVVAIIGLLLTFVAPNVWNKMREANVMGTRAKMTQLKVRIEDYRRQNNKAPGSLEELLQPSDRNMGEAYVESEEELKDAWGNFFQFVRINNNKFDIISLGADGVEGGEADDSDIHSSADAMPGH